MPLTKKHFISLAARCLRLRPELKPENLGALRFWAQFTYEISSFCSEHGPNYTASTFQSASGLLDANTYISTLLAEGKSSNGS